MQSTDGRVACHSEVSVSPPAWVRLDRMEAEYFIFLSYIIQVVLMKSVVNLHQCLCVVQSLEKGKMSSLAWTLEAIAY